MYRPALWLDMYMYTWTIHESQVDVGIYARSPTTQDMFWSANTSSAALGWLGTAISCTNVVRWLVLSICREEMSQRWHLFAQLSFKNCSHETGICVSLHPVLWYLTCTMVSLPSFGRSLLIPSSFTEVVTPTVISIPAVRWAAGSEG